MTPAVWGHRGTRRGAPENTLAAVRLALSQGADGIELDVRPCKSGELVVVHDRDLGRVAGDRRAVANLSWPELRAVELGDGQRVALLSEAAELVLGAGKRLNVEVKADVPDRAVALGAVISELSALTAGERARVVISTFDRALGIALRAGLPDVPVALLLSRMRPVPGSLDGVHPRHRLVNAARVASWHAAGLFVHAYTVNRALDARRLQQAGVDGIITDDVPCILEALAA